MIRRPPRSTQSRSSAASDVYKRQYQTLYTGIMTPGGSTVTALLAFFIASAAVRTFRARNLESTLLLITAIILMLSNVTIGNAISQYIPAVGNWLTNVPNATAQRGWSISCLLYTSPSPRD